MNAPFPPGKQAIRAWRTAEPTGKQGIKIESTKGGN